MKILVVGGAGYIGASLVPQFLQRGYEVEVADLFWFGCNLPEGITAIQRDAMELTEGDLEGFEQLVFLGGLSNDPMAEYSPSKNFVFNAATPAYLAYIAKRAGVRRYIYASSCSVYGYTVDRLFDEEAKVASSYPYGISKLQGEQAVLHLADPGFSVISLRKGTVSGFSPRMRFDLVVNTMFKTAMMNHEVNVNNPAIWRPILGIQDAVSAYIRAAEADYEISGIFNVISGNHTVGELGDIVKREIERRLDRPIRLNIQHKQDFRNYKVSAEKAARVLGYSPHNTVESIVAELWDHREAFGRFDDPSYSNIEVFRAMDGAAAAKHFRDVPR